MTVPYRFCITSGMPGCLPNYNGGVYEAHSLREFSAIVRSEFEALGYPQTAFRAFGVQNVWRRVQRNWCGSAVHAYGPVHNGECLGIHGLTEAEYLDAVGSE